MLEKIKAWWNKPRTPKECSHGFDAMEVVNLKIDPKCAYCGKTLTQIKNIIKPGPQRFHK